MVVNDPRLPAHFGHHPTRLHGDHRRHAGNSGRSKKPLALRHASSQKPGQRVPDSQQEQQRPQTHHDVPAQVDDVGLPNGGPLIRRYRIQTLDHRLLAGAGIGQPRGEAGNRHAAGHLTVLVEVTQSVSGTSLLVVGTSSIAANLTGWFSYTQRANPSPMPICIGVATEATVKAMTKPR